MKRSYRPITAYRDMTDAELRWHLECALERGAENTASVIADVILDRKFPGRWV